MDKDSSVIIEQLERTVHLLEDQKMKHSRPMLELILKRYQNGLEMIRNKPIACLKEEDFNIYGSVRAYLDAYNDYLNPVLEEMGKSEELLTEYFK